MARTTQQAGAPAGADGPAACPPALRATRQLIGSQLRRRPNGAAVQCRYAGPTTVVSFLSRARPIRSGRDPAAGAEVVSRKGTKIDDGSGTPDAEGNDGYITTLREDVAVSGSRSSPHRARPDERPSASKDMSRTHGSVRRPQRRYPGNSDTVEFRRGGSDTLMIGRRSASVTVMAAGRF
jgi:hypothetical protein